MKLCFFQYSCMVWDLDYKESWVTKNWRFWTVVLEKTLESPLDSKEIQLVQPKGNQSWIFIGWTDAEAPILWPPGAKNWLIRKAWCWKRLKGGGEGENRRWMASPTQWTWVWATSGSWRWTGKSGCCSPWHCKESDTIEQLNWTELKKEERNKKIFVAIMTQNFPKLMSDANYRSRNREYQVE